MAIEIRKEAKFRNIPYSEKAYGFYSFSKNNYLLKDNNIFPFNNISVYNIHKLNNTFLIKETPDPNSIFSLNNASEVSADTETKNLCEVNNIIAALKMLKSKDLACFKELIYEKDSLISDEEFIKLMKERVLTQEVVCPHCESKDIVKNGKNALKRQRYKCKSCKKIFSDFTKSPMSYSKKTEEQWLNYIKCMCKKLPIRESAEIVNIHRNTAFHWRHKILNAIKSKLPDNLQGIIEIDEIYIEENFKGNHSKDPNFSKKRSHRKKDNKYGVEPTEETRVCILCCKDRNENIFCQTACKGLVKFETVNSLLNERIPKGSILCTINKMYYQSFAKRKKLKIYKIRWESEVKKGLYHIKDVRHFGRKLICFIRDFQGVATKYLNHYISWLKWLELNQKNSLNYKLIDIMILLMNSKEKLRVCDFKEVKSVA